jgi:hypothetical protein
MPVRTGTSPASQAGLIASDQTVDYRCTLVLVQHGTGSRYHGSASESSDPDPHCDKI